MSLRTYLMFVKIISLCKSAKYSKIDFIKRIVPVLDSDWLSLVRSYFINMTLCLHLCVARQPLCWNYNYFWRTTFQYDLFCETLLHIWNNCFIRAMPWCTVHLLQLHVPDNCYKFTVNHGITGLITLFNAKRFILFWVELDLDAWFVERFTSVFGNVHDAFEFVLYRFVYFLYRLWTHMYEFSKAAWRKFSRVQDYVCAAKLVARSGHTVVYWSWQLIVGWRGKRFSSSSSPPCFSEKMSGFHNV